LPSWDSPRAGDGACRAGQVRPYIGFAYPPVANRVRRSDQAGGQGLDDVNEVLVTGRRYGQVVEYFRRLNNQETQLLNEQLKDRSERRRRSPPRWPDDDIETPMMIRDDHGEDCGGGRQG